MIIENKEKPKKNEISVWAVGTELTMKPKILKKQSNIIKDLKGFIGASPQAPHGILWLFDTKENAHIGRAIMIDKGITTGNNIVEVFIDKEFVGK